MELYRDDPDICQALRQAAHRILYTVANSNAMNGIDSNVRIVTVTPWWQVALYCLICLCAVAVIFSGYRLFSAIKKSKKA